MLQCHDHGDLQYPQDEKLRFTRPFTHDFVNKVGKLLLLGG